MKKVIFLFLLVLVGFGAYWLSSQKVAPTASNSPEAKLKIFDTHSKEGNDSLGYTINLTYPQIFGLPTSTQNEANRLIQDFITTTTAQFKLATADFKSASGSPASELQIDYTLTALNTKILSLEFNVYEYMSGAAHPNSFIHTFNYNLKELKLVTSLQDVFASGANYLPIVSELSRDALKEQLKAGLPGLESDILSGTEPKDENFKEFVLTTHGLKLIFNPYQVGPYVLGGQQVWIPYEKLKDVLPSNSFLLDYK